MKINQAQDNETQVYNDQSGGSFDGSLLIHTFKFSLDTCSPPYEYYEKEMNMLRCSEGGEMRETKPVSRISPL